MSFSTKTSGVARVLWAVCFAVIFALSSNSAHAQIDTGTGDDGGDTQTGARFQPEEVDLSAFEDIERSTAIGTSQTQGFGVAAESTGGPTGGGGAGGGFGGGGGLGGLGGLFGGLGGAFGGQGASSQKPIIRVRIRAAVGLPPRPSADVQRSATRTLSSAPRRSGVNGVNVTMQGGTAILRGAVASDWERRMSELLIRLEPGVKRVDNRVIVAGN